MAPLSRIRLLAAAALGLLLGLGAALAQPLTELLPAETFLAFGTRGLTAEQARLQPFIDEFERLELPQAFEQLMASEAGSEGESLNEAAASLEGLTLFDLLGQEAWLAVSATSYSPLPAVTVLTRLSAEASARASAMIAQAAQDADLESFSEGDYTFYQEPLGEDAGGQVLAFAQAGDLLAASSNPDVLRGVLRQLGGANEPSFAASQGYAASLGALGEGNLYSYFDYAQLARVLEPFANGIGFEELVARLAAALHTAGVQAGVWRLTDAGYESKAIQLPDAEGGDGELYRLITSGVPANTATLELVPEGALGWQSSSVDLLGWWNYLNGLVASSPEIGGDLDTLAQGMLGLDLRGALFSWSRGQLSTITTGVGEASAPGVASTNLLGDMVFVLGASDTAAAQSGLDTFFQTLSRQVAAFTNPEGAASGAASSTREVAGTTVTSYRMAEGITLETAVVGDNALIATSSAALDAVLSASGANPAFADLAAQAPAGATSVSVADNQASVRATAAQLVSQLQLLAGLGGSSELDFDAVEAASAKLQSYLDFVAERLGMSFGYQQKTGGTVRGFGSTEVRW